MRSHPPDPKSPESASGGAQFWALLVPRAPPCPTAQTTAGEPGGPVRTSQPDHPPSQAAACTGRRPSEPKQTSDSQPVRAPFPEKPHQH